ncbi:hypothetical protein L3i23_04340 [Herbiconiux sp. L3-i23]|nr:hypothetical protein L3i23_04340 [Herbiconiux sp. L3-i23]
MLATALFGFAFGGQAVRNLIGWPGFVTVAVALFAVVLVTLWRHRFVVVTRTPPLSLVAFLVFSALSLLWSQYQWATSIGLAAQWSTALAGIAVAATLPWPTIVRSLSQALTGLLAASLAFEAFVSFVLRRPVAPVYLDLDGSSPGAFWWSENHLLEFGPIQGVVGNRNLLAFLALLALIVVLTTAIESARISRFGLALVALAVVTLVLTRSATVILAAAAVAIVAVVAIAVRRAPAHHRAAVYGAAIALLAIAVAFCATSAHTVLALLGRGDMTGRRTIWMTVAWLAEQQPLVGWGWISYWAPWVPPFNDLIVIDGVEYLQAHNALLDIWLQLGLVGVAIALVAAVAATLGTWRMATDPHAIVRTALPALLLTALLFQSLTESRLLIEGNWMLFVVLCCIATRRDDLAAGAEATELLRSSHDLDRRSHRVRERRPLHALRRRGDS